MVPLTPRSGRNEAAILLHCGGNSRKHRADRKDTKEAQRTPLKVSLSELRALLWLLLALRTTRDSPCAKQTTLCSADLLFSGDPDWKGLKRCRGPWCHF